MTVEVPIDWCGRYWRDNHDTACASLIREYADKLLAGEEPPPIDVTEHARDGKVFYGVRDGYHRLHAHHLAGRKTIRAIVVESDTNAPSHRTRDLTSSD